MIKAPKIVVMGNYVNGDVLTNPVANSLFFWVSGGVGG